MMPLSNSAKRCAALGCIRLITSNRMANFTAFPPTTDAKTRRAGTSSHDDGVPAGSFGDFRTDLSRPRHAKIGREFTHDEKIAHRARMAAAQREREAANAKAREQAAMTWQAAGPAPEDHPYLAKKGVKSYGLRVRTGSLLIPLFDGSELHSLQFIEPDGFKMFLPVAGQRAALSSWVPLSGRCA